MKYRLGKKQSRAILTSEGDEVVVFPKGKEELAAKVVDLLNKDSEPEFEVIRFARWIKSNARIELIDFKGGFNSFTINGKALNEYELYENFTKQQYKTTIQNNNYVRRKHCKSSA